MWPIAENSTWVRSMDSKICRYSFDSLKIYLLTHQLIYRNFAPRNTNCCLMWRNWKKIRNLLCSTTEVRPWCFKVSTKHLVNFIVFFHDSNYIYVVSLYSCFIWMKINLAKAHLKNNEIQVQSTLDLTYTRYNVRLDLTYGWKRFGWPGLN